MGYHHLERLRWEQRGFVRKEHRSDSLATPSSLALLLNLVLQRWTSLMCIYIFLLLRQRKLHHSQCWGKNDVFFRQRPSGRCSFSRAIPDRKRRSGYYPPRQWILSFREQNFIVLVFFFSHFWPGLVSSVRHNPLVSPPPSPFTSTARWLG